MQVSVENTGPLGRKMRVEVPEDKIVSEVNNRLQSLSRTTRIQGFRPGKAPLKVVQKHYGSRVRQEVISEFMQSSFYEALTKEQLRPAGQPTIDPLDTDQGKGLVYTATFDIYPEIDLAPIENLKITKPICTISENDIDQMIEVLRKQKRKLQAVVRESQEDDVIVINFKGSINGEAFEGGEAEDFQLELGSKRLIPGFEDGLLGAKVGDELTLKLKFPDEYHKQELAGQPVEFNVTVKALHEQTLPELDDELFASLGVKEGGLEAFKQEIGSNMEREAEQKILDQVKIITLDAIYAANKINLPSGLIEHEAERLHEQFKANLKSQGINSKDIISGGPTVFNEQAEKRVALQLIVADIVKKNQIKVDPAQLRSMIEKYAQSYEDPNQVINWYYSDQQKLAEVEALALEDEVVKWVLSKAKVEEQGLTFDALMNKGQTETV
jgi:trigger factor